MSPQYFVANLDPHYTGGKSQYFSRLNFLLFVLAILTICHYGSGHHNFNSGLSSHYRDDRGGEAGSKSEQKRATSREEIESHCFLLRSK